MAHRGRLNVLTQVMGKPHRAIFHEFKGGSYAPDEVEGSGDVKYHLGASSDREFDGNKVHLSLTANPSHLEIVDPVVMGKARAKQDIGATQSGTATSFRFPSAPRSCRCCIHGDAAFAGQGVIAEILGLSGLRGHRVAGTMHVIINNQIGFTTNPAFSRSSPYPSDVAKMIEAPIFHVNGDDPEAVVYAAKVATEFRMKFHKPVVVDMFCYRRYGHNEGDEPSFTQPKMYKVIRAHKTVLQIYAERLVAEGLLTEGEVEKMKADWRAHLEQEFEAGQSYKPNKADWLDGEWSGLRTADNADEQRRGKTGVPMKQLKEIGRKLSEIPAGFNAHRTIQRFMENRAQHDRRPAKASTGRWRKRWPSVRSSSTDTRSVFRARIANAARSRSVIRCSTIRRPKSATSRSPTCRRRRHATKSSTRCCRKRPCLASNTATRWPVRTR